MSERGEIIRKAKRIRAECIQILNDAEYWNSNVRKPYERLIDPDPDGELADTISRIDEMLKNEVPVIRTPPRKETEREIK